MGKIVVVRFYFLPGIYISLQNLIQIYYAVQEL